jgi:hypothetical protein
MRGSKSPHYLAAFSAWLKPCPCTKASVSPSVSASCKESCPDAKWHKRVIQANEVEGEIEEDGLGGYSGVQAFPNQTSEVTLGNGKTEAGARVP